MAFALDKPIIGVNHIEGHVYSVVFENPPIEYPAMALIVSGGHTNLFWIPEEGKYHLDGHRKCGVCFEPEQSRGHGGKCPECGKPLTLGAQVIIADRESVLDGQRLRALIEKHDATVLQATPSGWRVLIEAGWAGHGRFSALPAAVG